MPTEIQPLLDLFSGRFGSLAEFLAWFAAVRIALLFVHKKIQFAVSDRLNAVATSESADDDAYLSALFAKPGYKFTAFLLLLIGIPIPTSADLERAIRLQHEALAKHGVKGVSE